MEKVKLFFEKIKLLSNEEFKILEDSCLFKISKKNGLVIIKIFPQVVIPVDIFLKISNSAKDFANFVKIIFDYSECIWEYENIVQYLMFYVKNLDSTKNNFKSILIRQKGKIENKNLYIYYLNKVELSILNENKFELNNFFKNIGFNFNSIEFIMDEIQKEVEMYKNRKINAVAFINNTSSNDAKPKKIFKAQNNLNIKVHSEKIADLFLEQQYDVISAKIFDIQKIPTKNNKEIYKIFVTDYSDSILLKVFPRENGITKQLIESLKINDWIKAKIMLNRDIFENNDLVGVINQLIILENNDLEEQQSDIERVEFITHTNMSAFEGVSSLENIVKKAKKRNYKYVSICDKFNCHYFPDMSNIQANENDLNFIYGFQANILNEQIKGAINEVDLQLSSATYILFDIETTGLYPVTHELIEFGAIKYENGVIKEKKQFFIKPTKPIPEKIIQITKIDNNMVADGYDLLTALHEIKNFFGQHVLVAHNGINFDIAFINYYLAKNNIAQITNPLIDTMIISRSINETYKQHSLGYIANKLKLNYSPDIAHRADFDAEILLEVWKNFINQLKDKNIYNIKQINQEINNPNLLKRTFPFLINIHSYNEEGIKSIYKLVSLSSTERFYSNPSLFFSDLLPYRNDLMISNSPTEGDIWNAALYDTDQFLLEKISKYDVIFVAPPSAFSHEINRQNLSEQDVKNTILRIIEFAKKANKKVLASSDSYYLDDDDAIYFRVYVHTKSIGGKPHRLYSYYEKNDILPNLKFKSSTELLNEFSFLGKNLAYEIVVTNTLEIAEKFTKKITPLKNKLYSPKIKGAKQKLIDLAWKKLKEKYGQTPHISLCQRFEWELKSIIDNGYEVVYWFSHLLVKKSLDDGYLVGSRGSVGSSLVATMINITDVNPLPPHYICDQCKYFQYIEEVDSGYDLVMIECPKCSYLMSGDGHNIPFETFMGFNGNKVPDIDLNFSAQYQAIAHNFIKQTFGKEHVFRAGTISTVAQKTAYGYVKGYFESINKTNVKNAEILRLVKGCQDVKRTTGQHPGGIIVVPKEYEVFDFTPYNYPADDTSQDWFTTHFTFESLHDSLLKFDILGHDSPTVLRALFKLTNVNLNDIPHYDKNVMRMFSDISVLKIDPKDFLNNTTGSTGIPEFGTSFVKEMLKITQPQCFSDLIKISGLSHGTDVWVNNAKDLIEKNNLSISEVISCRDDIMVYLSKMGLDKVDAFSIMENIRKGKQLSAQEEEILLSHNIPQWYIDSCNKIKYLFPKAHATAYVSMAWKIAWFKLYYPLQFYATYLSIRINVFDLDTILEGEFSIRNAYNTIKNKMNNPAQKANVKAKEKDLLVVYEIVLEMYLRGYKIKSIDLNKSLETEFIIDGDCLIPPFNTIDGLGEAVAKSVIESRNKKKFSSVRDLINRTNLNKNHIKKLKELGAFSDLPEDEQLVLFK